MLAALFLSGCAAFHGHAIGSSARGAVRASAVEQPVSSSRRAATGLLLQAGALSLLGAAPRPASAGFFESQEQEQVRAVATAQPKITSMVSEVAEVARKRKKMAKDPEDDAYTFRFARAVIDPASTKVREAAPALAKALGGTEASDRMSGLPDELQKQVAALDAACRANNADSQLETMKAIDTSIQDFLSLASEAKQDVTSKDDINGYTGGVPVLYNKFLFRAG